MIAKHTLIQLFVSNKFIEKGSLVSNYLQSLFLNFFILIHYFFQSLRLFLLFFDLFCLRINLTFISIQSHNGRHNNFRSLLINLVDLLHFLKFNFMKVVQFIY